MSTPITLLPGTLPAGYCYPDDPQQLNLDIVTRILAFLDQNFPGIYVGPTSAPPPADQRDRVWINSDNQLAYQYLGGKWRRTYQFAAANSGLSPFLVLWTGLAADIDSFDGGSPGAVSDTTGPLWQIVAEFAGSVPIGVGLIPGSSPAATITAPGDTKDSLGATGEYAHVLTELEGAVGGHQHYYGVSDPTASAAAFRKSALNTVPAYTGRFIGGNPPNDFNETTADMQTLASGTDGKGVVPSAAHLNMQPYRGVYFIARTARKYVFPPY